MTEHIDCNKNYQELIGVLEKCKEGTEEEFKAYQQLVVIIEQNISELEEDLSTEVINPDTSELLGWNPTFLDDFAAPMDYLSRLYMERGEYAKALTLLESVLPIYRVLEIYNSNYTYQRCYAMNAMVECQKAVGNKNLAILYGYELKHLQRDVLEAREDSITSGEKETEYHSYLVKAAIK